MGTTINKAIVAFVVTMIGTWLLRYGIDIPVDKLAPIIESLIGALLSGFAVWAIPNKKEG